MANTRDTYRRKYGLDWPKNIHDIQIDLILAKKWMLKPYKFGSFEDPGEHLLRAIRALFTKDQWGISPWTEEHAHAWASENFSVWLGAASTGKSNDAGGLAVLDWVTDPTDTYIALASTSVQMLKIRSYESVIRYFRHLKGNPHFLIPGKEATSMTAIINDNEDESNQATIKASIRGVALQDGGSQDKAIAKLAGAHLPFVTLILDEGAVLPPAASKARINARAGTKRFRFLSLANPISYNDEATKFCEPLAGWPTVDEHVPSWRSRFGLVLHHNGYDSPAITEEGAEKYPFLINKEQIDTIVREEGHNNDDAPIIYTMVKGWPCPVGLENTVLSEADIISFNLKGDPEWAEMYSEDFVRVAGLDPAFTSGGDNCVLQTATVGFLRGGVYAIAFDPPDYVPIKASSNRPAIYQVVEGTRDLLVQKGIPLENVGIDDSGTQSVADVYEVELGVVPVRCSFASKASEEFSETGEALQKKFANLVTEMWADVAKLGRNGQLRGLNNKAALQFCSRFYKKGIKPLALESKKDYKKRLSGQNSPDEGDALSICARVAKIKAGLVPGGGKDIGIMERNPISSIVNVSKKLSSSYGKGLDISRLKGYRIPK